MLDALRTESDSVSGAPPRQPRCLDLLDMATGFDCDVLTDKKLKCIARRCAGSSVHWRYRMVETRTMQQIDS